MNCLEVLVEDSSFSIVVKKIVDVPAQFFSIFFVPKDSKCFVINFRIILESQTSHNFFEAGRKKHVKTMCFVQFNCFFVQLKFEQNSDYQAENKREIEFS